MEEINKDTGLEMSGSSQEHLSGAANWAKFIAIVGFVGVGMMVIGGLLFGTIMSAIDPEMEGLPFPTVLISFIYIIFAVVYFFPVLYLYRFTVHSRKALSQSDSGILSDALKNLKLHYRFFGIVIIVGIGMYLIIGLVMIAVSVFLS